MFEAFKVHFSKILNVILLVITGIAIYVAAMASQVENLITLPPFSYSDLSTYDYGYVMVSGTLTSTTENGIASPLNTSTFTCDLWRGTCDQVQAELFNDNYLTTYTETFDINTWDDNFIVFQTTEENTQCVVWTYRIDRVKKELIGVRERASNYDYDSCMGIGLDKFEVKLVDGLDVILGEDEYN